MRGWMWLAAALATASCGGGPKEARVDGAYLAQADGVEPAAPASTPTVVVRPAAAAALPETGAARLAVDRDVRFAQVEPLLVEARRRGQPLSILVGDRRQRIMAIALPDPPSGPSIRVVAERSGKTCVSLPEVAEAKCVATLHERVDRAYTRELVREAVRAGGLRQVSIEVDPDLRWGDVIRAVDGARTCCEGETMTVGLTHY
jgi:hypothetical protein